MKLSLTAFEDATLDLMQETVALAYLEWWLAVYYGDRTRLRQ